MSHSAEHDKWPKSDATARRNNRCRSSGMNEQPMSKKHDLFISGSFARTDPERDDQGIRELKRHVALVPMDVDAVEHLAALLSRAGRYDAAYEVVRTGVRLHPREAGLWMALANVHERTGDRWDNDEILDAVRERLR